MIFAYIYRDIKYLSMVLFLNDLIILIIYNKLTIQSKTMSNPKKKIENKPKYIEQLEEIAKSPQNTFFIAHPEVLGKLTQQSKEQLKKALKQPNEILFKKAIMNWVVQFDKQKELNQMLVQIKQLKQHQGKYMVTFLPVFKKYSFPFRFTKSFHKLEIGTKIHDISQEGISSIENLFKVQFRFRQCQLTHAFRLRGPLSFTFGQKWGEPIEEKWVSDSKMFKIKYSFLNNQVVKRVEENKQVQIYDDSLIFLLKGSENRLLEKYNTFKQSDYLKKNDVFEFGYSILKSKNWEKKRFISKLQILLGTDFSRSIYGKLYSKFQYSTIWKARQLKFTGGLGLIEGKNLTPNLMFHRNQQRWMGQRSKAYANLTAEIFPSQFNFFDIIKLKISNYASFWLSKSYESKIKAESEVGICFCLSQTSLYYRLSLLKLAGTKGQPRFGLKYDF